MRDNASGAGVAPDTFWTDALVGDVNTGLGGRPRYDQNDDKLMWVRTQAEVRGRERAIVGLIRIEPRPIKLPAHAILAGRFKTTNNGNHSAAIVDTTGLARRHRPVRPAERERSAAELPRLPVEQGPDHAEPDADRLHGTDP